MPIPPLDDNLFDGVLDSFGLPDGNDVLFTSQEDWWNNACLNWSGGSWSLYAAGYKEAADLLVVSVETRSAGQDTLVYPILFLYRQYLELEIKDTLRISRRLLDIDGDFPMHHRINDLWNDLHVLLERISPGNSSAELKQIARLINDFAKVDPQSMAFRYPVGKSGLPSLPGLTRINLRNVREVLGKISIILSGANSQIYEYLQEKLYQERQCGNEDF